MAKLKENQQLQSNDNGNHEKPIKASRDILPQLKLGDANKELVKKENI